MPRFLKITAFVFTISIIGAILIFQHFFSEHIVWGVKVNDISLGGLTTGVAEKRLQILADRLENMPLYFTYENKRWSLEPGLAGVKVDLTGTLEKAYKIGRKGTFTDRIREFYGSLNQGREITLKVNWDDRKLDRVLSAMSNEIHVSPQSVGLEIAGDRVRKTSNSKEGRELMVKETKDRLKSVLSRGGNKIEVAVMKAQPALTDEVLEQIGLLNVTASFSTRFNPAEKERSRNIEIAANSLKGYVIKPGETFSFNSVVGPRSEEEGYKKAMVIVNGKFVPDWGGGVCQVSTTLYNAALLVDMSIIERREHSRPVKYIPPGRGSTVAYGLIDLKFRNPLPKPMIIWSKKENNNLTVYFLGEKVFGKEVLIESSDFTKLTPAVITRESDELPIGEELVEEEGANGYQVTTWRIVKQNGKTDRREMIGKDRVDAIDRSVVTGTKEIAP